MATLPRFERGSRARVLHLDEAHTLAKLERVVVPGLPRCECAVGRQDGLARDEIHFSSLVTRPRRLSPLARCSSYTMDPFTALVEVLQLSATSVPGRTGRSTASGERFAAASGAERAPGCVSRSRASRMPEAGRQATIRPWSERDGRSSRSTLSCTPAVLPSPRLECGRRLACITDVLHSSRRCLRGSTKMRDG